jgi:phosphonate transport system permease protein
VFGLGGLGSDLRLSLQSLEFRELWSGLWLLMAVMLALEAGLARLRRRWLMPPRLGLARPAVGRRGREMVAALLALLPLVLLVGRALAVDPADLLAMRPLPGLATTDWRAAFALPWPQLLGGTLALTLLAAALAVGLAPLQLLLAAPAPWAGQLVRLGWAFGRLWPPPLIALLLLFVLKPGLVTAALALGLHNLGILGRLLAESLEGGPAPAQEALRQAGCGPRLALLYGGFSPVARSYLAYGAYRADVMLRETVVVGLVGAAGLGSALLESLSAFAWDQVAVLVGAYALLTLAGEELSDRVRRRLAVRMAAV